MKRRNEKGERIYCVCRGVDDGSFMIECDTCKDWFHGRCVNVDEDSAPDEYECPNCSSAQQPTIIRNKRQRPVAKKHSLRMVCQRGFQTCFADIFPDADHELWAKQAEDALFAAYHDAEGPTAQYKARYRSLLFNLKSTTNSALRQMILDNPDFESIVRLDASDLNPDLKAKAERVQLESLKHVFKPKKQELDMSYSVDESHSVQDSIKLEASELSTELSTSSGGSKASKGGTETPSQSQSLDELVAKINRHTAHAGQSGQSVEARQSNQSQHQSQQQTAGKTTSGLNLDDLVAKIANQNASQPGSVGLEQLVANLEKSAPRSAEPAGDLDDLLSKLGSSEASANAADPGAVADQEYNPESENQREQSDRPEETSRKRIKVRAELDCPLSVWKGKLVFPQVATTSTHATTLDAINPGVWPALLKHDLFINGRISRDKVVEYLSQITKLVVLVTLPADAVFDYLVSKSRCGVVKPSSSKIKDFYLVPLKQGESLDVVNVKPVSENRLVGVLVLQQSEDALLASCGIKSEPKAQPKTTSKQASLANQANGHSGQPGQPGQSGQPVQSAQSAQSGQQPVTFQNMHMPVYNQQPVFNQNMAYGGYQQPQPQQQPIVQQMQQAQLQQLQMQQLQMQYNAFPQMNQLQQLGQPGFNQQGFQYQQPIIAHHQQQQQHQQHQIQQHQPVAPVTSGLVNAQGQLDPNLIGGLLAQFMPKS